MGMPDSTSTARQNRGRGFSSSLVSDLRINTSRLGCSITIGNTLRAYLMVSSTVTDTMRWDIGPSSQARHVVFSQACVSWPSNSVDYQGSTRGDLPLSYSAPVARFTLALTRS